MKTRQTWLQKTDSKMQPTDYANYPNCTFLWVTRSIWLWPQFYQSGDTHVKARYLIGKSCTTFNGTLWTQSGSYHQLDHPLFSLLDQTIVWPYIVGFLSILPSLRGMYYFHSTSREDLLSVWNHWVHRKMQFDKLNKVLGTGPVWIFMRFLLKFEFDILPNGEISCNQRNVFIFDEDRGWSWICDCRLPSYHCQTIHTTFRTPPDWPHWLEGNTQTPWDFSPGWTVIAVKRLTGSIATGSQLSKWHQYQDNPTIQFCPFCGQTDTLHHRFHSCTATAHLRREFPDVLGISTPKLTTGLLHFGYDFSTLKIFQMIRSLQHVEPFHVHEDNQEPFWVWTDGTA